MTENWGLLGHEWAVDLLRSHVAEGRVRHAYLFTGPHGVGRRTLALRLAQVLNSPDGQYDPEDLNGQKIAQMQHPDLSIVERQEGDRDIKIEFVRALQHTLSLSPYMSKYRVALLLGFENANPNAANALLKTLEEPSPRVVLMLTAESVEALLPTISSRCEVIRLRPVKLETLAQGLEEQYGLPPDQARLLAHISGGKPGYALHLAQNDKIMGQRAKWLDEHGLLINSKRVARFGYAQKMTKDKDKEKVIGMLLVWLAYWRDALMRVSGSHAPLTNLDRQAEIESLASAVDLETARQTVLAIEQKLAELRGNVNLRLAVEALMLQIPNI